MLEGQRYAWLGGHRQEAGAGPEGFAWTDGTEWTFDAWAAGEPNNWKSREDCMMIGWKKDMWNDRACYFKMYPLCSYQSPAKLVKVFRSLAPNGDVLDDFFSSRYVNQVPEAERPHSLDTPTMEFQMNETAAVGTVSIRQNGLNQEINYAGWWDLNVAAGNWIRLSTWIKFGDTVPRRSLNFGLMIDGVVYNEWMEECQPNEWCYASAVGPQVKVPGSKGTWKMLSFGTESGPSRILFNGLHAEVFDKEPAP